MNKGTPKNLYQVVSDIFELNIIEASIKFKGACIIRDFIAQKFTAALLRNSLDADKDQRHLVATSEIYEHSERVLNDLFTNLTTPGYETCEHKPKDYISLKISELLIFVVAAWFAGATSYFILTLYVKW